MKHPLLTCSLAVLSLLGCGGGKEEDEGSYADYEISDGVLAGEIAGEPWTFVSGYAEDLFGDGELWIELYAVEPSEGDPCGFLPYDFTLPSIIITIPAEEMDVELGFENNVTFYSHDGTDSVNEVVMDGRLIVDEVTDTTLSGALYAVGESDEVDGRFSVTICPPAE